MSTASNLKQDLKKSAKQFTNEPLELLKSAKRQIVPESLNSIDEDKPASNEHQDFQDMEKYRKQKAEKDGRTLQALENELKDIRRQKIFRDLLARIQGGEDIPLEEFSELTYEQRDVLKANMEAYKQKAMNSKNSNNELVEPTPKKGRQLFGQRQSAQKQTTRVEKPVPPSG